MDKARAARAVIDELATRNWTPRHLQAEADVDAKTMDGFLASRTWPQRMTRARIEKALGWQVGTLEDLAAGINPPPPPGEPAYPGMTAEEAIDAAVDLTDDERAYLKQQLSVARVAFGQSPSQPRGTRRGA